jgi:hypothetical protein
LNNNNNNNNNNINNSNGNINSAPNSGISNSSNRLNNMKNDSQQQQQQAPLQQLQFNQPFQFNNNQNNSLVNPKIINDSNKFIENILAHSKRNLKPPPSLRVNNSDSRNQLQLLSASLNLPPNVITINRTNEERFLFPDKLILER